jgi:hypothetical protein
LAKVIVHAFEEAISKTSKIHNSFKWNLNNTH